MIETVQTLLEAGATILKGIVKLTKALRPKTKTP